MWISQIPTALDANAVAGQKLRGATWVALTIEKDRVFCELFSELIPHRFLARQTAHIGADERRPNLAVFRVLKHFRRDENGSARACVRPISDVMKISHIATVALLTASAISSLGAISLVVHQYTVQRSAVQVVADTALVERMQGLTDAINYVPMSERHALLSEYGFLNEEALQTALPAQRRDLESAQQARAEELSTNDKRLAALLAICGFNAIVAVMTGIAFYDIAARRRRRLSGGRPMSHAMAHGPKRSKTTQRDTLANSSAPRSRRDTPSAAASRVQPSRLSLADARIIELFSELDTHSERVPKQAPTET